MKVNKRVFSKATYKKMIFKKFFINGNTQISNDLCNSLTGDNSGYIWVVGNYINKIKMTFHSHCLKLFSSYNFTSN